MLEDVVFLTIKTYFWAFKKTSNYDSGVARGKVVLIKVILWKHGYLIYCNKLSHINIGLNNQNFYKMRLKLTRLNKCNKSKR